MKTRGGSEDAKRRAAEAAVEAVEDGMVVGLGTGSTTAYAIEAIGGAVADGLAVRGIPTSFQARRLAIEVDIPLTSLDAVDRVDLAIDGADQVATRDEGSTAGTTLIKGGGGAQAREKVLAAAADRFLVVVDDSKLAEVVDHQVPVEVLPAAHSVVADRICALGGEAALRTAECKDGPVVTDNGNLLIGCDFGEVAEPGALAASLSAIPGVVEHGLFVDLANAVYVGFDDGVERREY